VRYVLTVLGIVAVIGLLVAIKGAQIAKLIGFGKAMAAQGPQPESVSTALAEDQEWEELITATGSVTTARGVSLSTDIAGVVSAIRFESGATVKAGQVLVELDSAVERAQLASAVARRSLANTNAARTRQLVQSGAIAPSQLDNDSSIVDQSTTDAEAIGAQIARKTIRAPFAGRIGIRQINLGQYLQPGTPVAVIEGVETAHVDFTVPQQQLSELKVGMPVRITTEQDIADGGAPTSNTRIDARISTIDPTLDQITRTVQVRADIDDSRTDLKPGMFVKTAVILPKKGHYTVVPITAVIHATYGDSVFIVEDKAPAEGKPSPTGKMARQQFVRLGEARGDYVAVLDGVKPKQEIVTAGGFKLHNNWPVAIDNSKKTLNPQLAPTPENR
jgi:membrane fusion protein (multidrug efflux system)